MLIRILTIIFTLCCFFPISIFAVDNIKHDGPAYSYTKAGWLYIHVEGSAYDRGKQYGTLAAPQILSLLNLFQTTAQQDTGKSWSFWVKASQDKFIKQFDNKKYAEYLDEIKGIAAGAGTTWQNILAMNAFNELVNYWYDDSANRSRKHSKKILGHCSAFIATGSYTSDGKVVMAHSTVDDYTSGQYANIILDVVPAQGNHFVMQTFPGLIYSDTDYFITATQNNTKIMGTETTIEGFTNYQKNTGTPGFLRIRYAIQYANSLDEWCADMLDGNNGGLANSWLLANLSTNQIRRFDIGYQYHDNASTTLSDGYYVGYNAAQNEQVRTQESVYMGENETNNHIGARRVRLNQLMKQYRGKINATVAEQILGDHYDVYLQEDNHPSYRTIDLHGELDDGKYSPAYEAFQSYQPIGSIDAKVTTSDLANQMSFIALSGLATTDPSLGFVAADYLKAHPEWAYLKPYLKDRPVQAWTQFP